MAMALPTAKFALARTTDPDLAARLADHLGLSAIDVVPAVAFPPTWVLAAQRSSAPFAAYAARHLADPETMEFIWSTTKRATVKQALAESQYLTTDLRRQFYEQVLGTKSRSLWSALLKKERDHSPAVAYEAVLEGFRSSPPIYATTLLGWLSIRDSLPVEWIDTLVTEGLAAGEFLPFVSALTARLGTRQSYPAFASSSYSLSALLGLAAQEAAARPHALTTALTNSVQAAFKYNDPSLAKEISADDTKALMQLLPHFPGTLAAELDFSAVPAPYFSYSAVDELLTNPTWFPVAALCTLSDDQFERLVSFDIATYRLPASGPNKIPEKVCVSMLLHQATTPARLSKVLDALPATSSINVWPDSLLTRAPEARFDFPLLARLLKFSGRTDHFLVNGADIAKGKGQEEKVLPSLAFLNYLVDSGHEFKLSDMIYQISYKPAVSAEYIDHLLLHVPDLARIITSDTKSSIANDVYRLLTAHCGADVAIALEMLDRPGVSLAQVCDTASRLRA
jgi:hypothetical protein